MAKIQEKIPTSDWLKLDPNDMPANLQKLYAAKQAADKAAREARETFEASYCGALVAAKAMPEGRVARFGYNFGQLSVADPRKHNFPAKNGSGNAGTFNPFAKK